MTDAAHPRRRRNLAKATQIIWLLTGILEIFIGIRVVLKLLAANPQVGFARFIYGITQVFLVPFLPLFSQPSAEGSVLEISSLVAMLVYALFAWGVVRVMWVVLMERPTSGGGPGAPLE
ncbi:MAG: YggT family protein [Chloroflexota bacterium]